MLPNDIACTNVILRLITGETMEGKVLDSEGYWMALERTDGQRVLVNVVHIMTMVAV